MSKKKNHECERCGNEGSPCEQDKRFTYPHAYCSVRDGYAKGFLCKPCIKKINYDQDNFDIKDHV